MWHYQAPAVENISHPPATWVLLQPSTLNPQVHLDFFFPEMSRLECLVLQPKPQNAITIAVSSRVLFNMEKEQQIFEQQGMEEYIQYQVAHETEPFSPGPAFSFVKVRDFWMRGMVEV